MRASCGANTSSWRPCARVVRHMTATLSAPPLSERLVAAGSSRYCAPRHVCRPRSRVRRARRRKHPQPGVTLTTPGLLDRLPELVDRYSRCRRCRRRDDPEHRRRRKGHGLRRAVSGDPNHGPGHRRGWLSRQIPVFPGGLTPSELVERLAGRRDRGQDLSGTDGRRRLPQAPPGPVPRPARCPVRRGRPEGHRQWLPAGAVAVSLGGPLLGDALRGGDVSALRSRCRAVRAVIDQTVPS